MCLGIPGEVVAHHPDHPDLVTVDVLGATRTVNVGLLDDRPAPGQWVLIHVGFALETLDPEAARGALAGLELLGRPDPVNAGPDPPDRGPGDGSGTTQPTPGGEPAKEAAPWAP